MAYGSFSISDLFQSFVNSETAAYVLLFLIFFAVIFIVLAKASLFKTHKRNIYGMPEEEVNRAAATMVAFSISALIVYYFYRNNYSLESLFGEIGIQGDAFSSALPIILLGLAIFFFYLFGRTTEHTFRGPVKKWSFFRALAILSLILGLGIILAVIFTDIISDKGIAFFVGSILVIIGIFSWKKSARTWLRNHRPTSY